MSNEMQGIIRVAHRERFTCIDNRLIKDTRLSRDARMLACEILTNRNDWRISIAYLVMHGQEGKHAVKRMIKELIKYGYLWMSDKDLRNEKGQFCGKQYVLYEHWSLNPHFNPEELEATEPEEVETEEANEDLFEAVESEAVEEVNEIEEPEEVETALVFEGGTKNYSNATKEKIRALLADCPKAQDVLDEVSYRLVKGKVKNVMGLLTHLKHLALKGEFVPTHQFKRQQGGNAYKPFKSEPVRTESTEPVKPEQKPICNPVKPDLTSIKRLNSPDVDMGGLVLRHPLANENKIKVLSVLNGVADLRERQRILDEAFSKFASGEGSFMKLLENVKQQYREMGVSP
ncbi:hypothetical protein BegalDRAFT_1459 [Beggiatoa alba B18LD]|uniref:Helix-turn-helix domain-containing protein n=1 Tax=Beggiatoa alba B18LD TaxID=395493 RepID=I3CFF4_9GAMM|nr:hypothetical protein [Beggiatoa alba]EIJ42347.1 hypothetical protein BegalDRAFT_1459 [Beggiatoa alba B18LD]